MASVPKPAFDTWFVHPLSATRLYVVGAILWFAGAAYCQGYEQLTLGGDDWIGSLIWSAHSVLPWFALSEMAKRPVFSSAVSPFALAAAVLLVAVGSILAETLLRWGAGETFPPAYLLVMRRLPPALVAVFVILVGRRLALKRASVRDDAEERLRLLSPLVKWIEAADNYVELHMDGRSEMLRMTMADAERLLASNGFRRIHRRYIVNTAQLGAEGHGEPDIRLADGTRLPVGKAYAARAGIAN